MQEVFLPADFTRESHLRTTIHRDIMLFFIGKSCFCAGTFAGREGTSEFADGVIIVAGFACGADDS